MKRKSKAVKFFGGILASLVWIALAFGLILAIIFFFSKIIALF